MAMRAFTNTPKSSGSIISGFPAAGSLFEFYENNYVAILSAAVNEVLASYEQEVRARARASWGDLADTITIGFNPDTFEVTFSAAPEAEALEYGDGATSPTAVLRNAAIEASQKLPSRISAKMVGK